MREPVQKKYTKENFPRATVPEGAISVRWHDRPVYGVELLTDVVYCRRAEGDLHLELFLPCDGKDPARRFPLLTFVQGSGWGKQLLFVNLPKLVRLCERGLAVAVVEYRTNETSRFPAQVQDTLRALAFLREHAETYRIDPDRISLWGDSSGGHTALLAAYAEEFREEGVPACPLRCLIDWYAPTDLTCVHRAPSLFDQLADTTGAAKLFGANPVRHPEVAKDANVMRYVDGRLLPPTLIMHGDMDTSVPYEQSVLLFEKLREKGYEVVFYSMYDGFHGGGGFDDDACLDVMYNFVIQHSL